GSARARVVHSQRSKPTTAWRFRATPTRRHETSSSKSTGAEAMRRAYTFLDRGDVYLCFRTDELGDFERPGHETLSPAEARQRLQTWVHEDNRLVLRELGRVLGLSLSGLVAQDDMRTLARALSECLANDMATHALVRRRTKYRNVGFILEKPV